MTLINRHSQRAVTPNNVDDEFMKVNELFVSVQVLIDLHLDIVYLRVSLIYTYQLFFVNTFTSNLCIITFNK